jgi:hypothetical protein
LSWQGDLLRQRAGRKGDFALAWPLHLSCTRPDAEAKTSGVAVTQTFH